MQSLSLINPGKIAARSAPRNDNFVIAGYIMNAIIIKSVFICVLKASVSICGEFVPLDLDCYASYLN